MMNNPKLLAVVTIVLWSFGSYLARLIAIRSQFLLLTISFFFALIAILAYVAIKNRDLSFLNIRSLKPAYVLFGSLGYFLYSVGLNQSSRHFNSMSETTILNYTWPVFTILFTDWIFSNKKAKKAKTITSGFIQYLGVALGFGAVLVLATKGNFSTIQINIPGILWGLLSGVSYGLYGAYSGTLQEKEQGRFLITSIFSSLILMAAFSIFEIGQFQQVTANDLLVTFVMGFLLNGVGYITWTSANRLAREQQVNIASVASLMFALPVISLIIVSALLGERLLLSLYFIISLLLTVSSFILCQETETIEKWLGVAFHSSRPAKNIR